jgi:hypothetical protein
VPVPARATLEIVAWRRDPFARLRAGERASLVRGELVESVGAL